MSIEAIVRFYAGGRQLLYKVGEIGGWGEKYYFEGLKHPFIVEKIKGGKIAISKWNDLGKPYFYRVFTSGVQL